MTTPETEADGVGVGERKMAHRTMRHEDWHPFIIQLKKMQRQCFDSGMILTAHALNTAEQQAGWEYAKQCEKALARAGSPS